MKKNGKFIVSLDFELFWGVRDIETVNSYGNNIIGVWEVIPKMLEMFEKFGIKATFATVGFLFASNKEELESYIPIHLPKYLSSNLSPYNDHFNLVKETEEEDKYHYALELINLIKKYPNHEIATHTFSHYYCLEKGQNLKTFKADIKAAIKIAKAKNIKLNSLVFPRHQINKDYLSVCNELGINSYRGHERAWFYKPTRYKDETILKRMFRLIDAYFNISGSNCYSINEISKHSPYNIPSSRFLRPYSSRLKFLEKLRLNRILNGMSHAAKNGKVFHLWWHPHNFGIFQNQNFLFLEKILGHYKILNDEFGFENLTMAALAELIDMEKTK